MDIRVSAADIDLRGTLDDNPTARDAGRPGDTTYYSPRGNLALFYGTGPNAPGLIPLGRLAADDVEALASLHGEVTIALEPRTEQP